MDFADLRDFVHGGVVNFFLRVETGAHGPFVEEMQERAGFDQADGFGVGKQIESDLRRHAAIEKLILGGPGILHGAIVDFLGAWILLQEASA